MISKKSNNAGVTACGTTSEFNLKLEALLEQNELSKLHNGPVAICHCGAHYHFDGERFDSQDSDDLESHFQKNGCPHCISLDEETDKILESVAWKVRNTIVEHEFYVDGVYYACIYKPVNFKAAKVTKSKDGVIKLNGYELE